MMAIPLEVNSKGLVLSLRKKGKKIGVSCSLPNKTWDISSRSRAKTATDKKARCTRKLSCCFANLNLLLFTVSFVAIVFVWRPRNHLCFKSCPTFRNTLTYRKTFHTVLRDILEWSQNCYRTCSRSCQKSHITFWSWLKLVAFLPTTFFEIAVYIWT